jgi:ribosomal protein S18 acetylase RimI-like enzyme
VSGPNAVVLRRESPLDREAVDALVTADVAAQFAASGVDPTVIASLLRMQAAARRTQYADAHPDAVAEVIDVAGRTVGVVLTADLPEATRIVDLAIAPDHRRRGIARAVVAQLCRAADARSRVLTLQVWTDNAAAIGLYESAGFAFDGSGCAGSEAPHSAGGRRDMTRKPARCAAAEHPHHHSEAIR